MLLGLLAAIFSLWGGIEMYFLKGSRQTNRFGANPLGPAARNTRPRWERNSEIEMVPHKAGPPPQWYVRSSLIQRFYGRRRISGL
jgi:hypothetical protein